MRAINYEKLMNFVRNNPMYEIYETEGTVELAFHAPSEEEAAGGSGDEEGAVMRIIFIKRGNELTPREAWVERGGVRRRIDLDELDSWLEFVDMYS